MKQQTVILAFGFVLLLAGVSLWFVQRIQTTAKLVKSVPVESQQNETCDLAQQSCRVAFSDMTADVIFLTKPQYLQPFEAEVVLRGAPSATVERVAVRFAMTGMQMALPEAYLKPANNSELLTSRWHNTVMIPVCASGRHDWVAEVTVTTQAKRYQAKYQLRMP